MEKTTRIMFGAAVCVAVLIATTQPVVAGIDNGAFDDGLAKWTISGSVWHMGGAAVLRQGDGDDPPDSVLSQMVTLGEDDNWLSFYLSIGSLTGGECDTFTATFDGAEICTWSNPEGTIIPPPGTITFDVSGYYDDADPSHEYELMFRLDHDATNPPTYITIDEVRLAPNSPMVPIPGALLLGGLGSALVVLLRRYV